MSFSQDPQTFVLMFHSIFLVLVIFLIGMVTLFVSLSDLFPNSFSMLFIVGVIVCFTRFICLSHFFPFTLSYIKIPTAKASHKAGMIVSPIKNPMFAITRQLQKGINLSSFIYPKYLNAPGLGS